jgi:hypothetical protein
MLGAGKNAVATDACSLFDSMLQMEATRASGESFSASSPQFHFVQSFGTFSLNFAAVSPCTQRANRCS